MLIAQDDNKDQNADKLTPGMPFGTKILLWIVTFNMVIATGFVWAMAFFVVHQFKTGIWVSMADFRDLMLGFHIILLGVSLIGWHMQGTWQKLGELMVYPTGLVIGSLMLDVAAIKLAIIAFTNTM
ncbi:MAG: hypothetical protein NTY09_04505 [bacterium]|nr:hypothetical protein [bacterium]